MRCLVVIPSRFPSTRLPGKPLKDIRGKTLLRRVWEQAKKAKSVTRVVVATDDKRIFEAATSYGAEVLMTSDQHLTGSDRVAEVSSIFSARGDSYDLVANVQGDMPFISPEVIDQTILALHKSDSSFGMSTVATPIISEDVFMKPSAVKVVLGESQQALYFSRASIPFLREGSLNTVSEEVPYGYKHMGLYVFRPDTLAKISSLSQTLPEMREKLEQLRALCHGVKIKVHVASNAAVHPSIEVDTPEDLEAAIQHAQTQV